LREIAAGNITPAVMDQVSAQEHAGESLVSDQEIQGLG